MSTRAFTLSSVLVLAAMAAPRPAQAQAAWIPYLSGFAGGSAIPAFDPTVTDAAIAAHLDVEGRKINNAAAWGGTLGVWKRRQGSRLRWGLRGDFSYQQADADAQMLPANGTLFGQPYSGPLPVPAADGSAIFVTGMFLLGWQLGDDTASAFGRVTPYVGVGAGIDRVSATFAGLGDASDTGGTFQAVGGVAVGLSHRVSAFAEYRYSRVTHNMVVGTQSVAFPVRPNQLVAGFTVGLF
jgi:opacity protein-like surface antigen